MDRRTFMQRFAGALAAGTVTGAPLMAAAPSWKDEFAAALARQPWLLGYKVAATAGYRQRQLRVEGTVPDGLRGTFYRNGPAQHEVGDDRYQHWFDGDGMVHAFRFHDGGASHIGRFVETDKYLAEAKAGRALREGFDTVLPGMEPVRSADQINTANINVIWHNGELLALWEGGSAYRLDPDTLKTLGLKTWSAETQGLPFSAHPRTDTDGTLWNFGYAAVANALVIYRIGADGALRDQGVIPMVSVPMVHDFMITETHLVFVLPPYVFEHNNEGSFLDHFEWRPERGGRALVVDKNDLTSMREIDLPPFWVFHFSNGFETGNGIEFQAPVYETPEAVTTAFRDVMRGAEVSATGATLISGHLNPATGAFDYEELGAGKASEFPRIDARRQGQRHRHTVLTQSSANAIGLSFDTVLRLNHDTGAADRHVFAAGDLAEEHIFVPNPESADEGVGWIIGTSLNTTTAQTAVNIFDAEHVADGPVARLWTDYPIPLGLHGNFVAL